MFSVGNLSPKDRLTGVPMFSDVCGCVHVASVCYVMFVDVSHVASGCLVMFVDHVASLCFVMFVDVSMWLVCVM